MLDFCWVIGRNICICSSRTQWSGKPGYVSPYWVHLASSTLLKCESSLGNRKPVCPAPPTPLSLCQFCGMAMSLLFVSPALSTLSPFMFYLSAQDVWWRGAYLKWIPSAALNEIFFPHFKLLFIRKVIYFEVSTCLLLQNNWLGWESENFLFCHQQNLLFKSSML